MGGKRREAEDFFGVSYKDFKLQRDRRYGTANPDLMEVPLWATMIKHGHPSYFLQMAYQESNPAEERPIWTFDRRGMTCTELPDRRAIYIGGEHEDSYDPNFCIFNGVIVRSPNGEYQIYGYPKHDFPPTDFHTATLVEGYPAGNYGNGIVIIGGLGYEEDRIPGITNVHVLQFDSHTSYNYLITRTDTKGDNPGWIWGHQAVLTADGESVIVFAGKAIDANGGTVPMDDVYRLDLSSLAWERVGDLPVKELLKPKVDDSQELDMFVMKNLFGHQGTEESLSEDQKRRIMLKHEIARGESFYTPEMLAELKAMLDALKE